MSRRIAKRGERNAARRAELQRLCPAHAAALGLSGSSYVQVTPTEDLGPDDEIECERCAVVHLRQLGVL